MSGPVVLDALQRGRWQDVTSFAKVNAQDMASRKSSLVQVLCIWLRSVALYHQTEMDVVPGGYPSEQDRQEQKFTLSVLINVGEWLVRELRQNDVTANVGATLADVEATLDELYVNQRVTFGGMTEERRKQVLDEVFGAAWQERIEAILAAWYNLQNCPPSERAKWRDQRNKLVDEAIAGTRSCPHELLEALGPRFNAYKLARRKEHEAKMAGILRRP